jgi:hypothetical protein
MISGSDVTKASWCTLSVTRTRVSVNEKALDSDVKTAAGRRTIPVDAHLVALLKAHDRQRKEERLRAGTLMRCPSGARPWWRAQAWLGSASTT